MKIHSTAGRRQLSLLVESLSASRLATVAAARSIEETGSNSLSVSDDAGSFSLLRA